MPHPRLHGPLADRRGSPRPGWVPAPEEAPGQGAPREPPAGKAIRCSCHFEQANGFIKGGKERKEWEEESNLTDQRCGSHRSVTEAGTHRWRRRLEAAT